MPSSLDDGPDWHQDDIAWLDGPRADGGRNRGLVKIGHGGQLQSGYLVRKTTPFGEERIGIGEPFWVDHRWLSVPTALDLLVEVTNGPQV